MSKVRIETQYFPTIAFYSLMVNADAFTLEQDENYQKGSYRNKTQIFSSQGPLFLSIPLTSGKNNQLNIKEVTIDYTSDWRRNHLRGINACYGKSPYFEYYISDIKKILHGKENYLFDLNFKIISKLNELLGINSKISFSENYQLDKDLNYRGLISSKKSKMTNLNSSFDFKYYEQVFTAEHGFHPNLSILDLLFCQGPESIIYLKSILNKI